MWTDDQGGVPVPLVAILSFPWFGPDVDRLLAQAVVPYHVTILGFGIDDIGIFGVNLRPEAIAPVGHEPVVTEHATVAGIPGRASHAVVVLGPSINVIERFGVVDLYPVKLRYGKVGLEDIFFSSIEGLVDTAITTN